MSLLLFWLLRVLGCVNYSVIRSINNSINILHLIIVVVVCIGSVGVILKMTKMLSGEVTWMSLYWYERLLYWESITCCFFEDKIGGAKYFRYCSISSDVEVDDVSGKARSDKGSYQSLIYRKNETRKEKEMASRSRTRCTGVRATQLRCSRPLRTCLVLWLGYAVKPALVEVNTRAIIPVFIGVEKVHWHSQVDSILERRDCVVEDGQFYL